MTLYSTEYISVFNWLSWKFSYPVKDRRKYIKKGLFLFRVVLKTAINDWHLGY